MRVAQVRKRTKYNCRFLNVADALDMSFFSNAKDRLLEGVALAYLNNTLLTPYGRATRLRIDSAAKNIHIEVELKGETIPVQVEVTDYEIIEESGASFAVIKAVRTSREWLTALAQERICQQRFKLPQQAAALLR